MAAITVAASEVRAVEMIEADSAVASVAITAGQYIRKDGTTGKWVLGSAVTGGADVGNRAAIALKSVAAGEPLEGLLKGVVNIGKSALTSYDFDAAIYLSDTEGGLDSAAGTVSKIVGVVEIATNERPYGKLLRVNL